MASKKSGASEGSHDLASANLHISRKVQELGGSVNFELGAGASEGGVDGRQTEFSMASSTINWHGGSQDCQVRISSLGNLTI